MEKNEQDEIITKEKKKISPIVLIIIGLILIVVVGCVAWFMGTKAADSKNANEESESKNSNSEKLDENSAVVKELFETFRVDKNIYLLDGLNNLDTVEGKKLVALLKLTDDVFSEKTCGSLSGQHTFDASGFIYFCGNSGDFSSSANTYYANKEWVNLDKAIVNNKTEVFSSSILKEKYEELFGANASYVDSNFTGVYSMWYYDAKNGVYAKFGCMCGGEDSGFKSQSLFSVEQSETTLKLVTTLYSWDDSSSEAIYTFKYEDETDNYVLVDFEIEHDDVEVDDDSQETEEEKTEDEKKEEEKTESTSKEEKPAKLNVNSAVVKKLFEVFKEDNCLEKDIFNNLNNSVDAKMYLAYSELSSSDFKEMKCSSLNATSVGGNYCGDDRVKTKTVSAKILEAKYKEIFGQNASYKNATFKLLEGPIAYYDSKNNVYAYFSCECGGECGGNYNHKLNSVEQSGATLKLNTTLTVDGSKKTIVYTFKYEESTGNYVFVSRESQTAKLDVNSAVVKELFEVFKEDNCLERDIFSNLNTSVDAKMYLAYSELSESDFKEMKCGSLNDSYVDGNYCAANDEAFKYYGSNESKFQAAIANEKTKTVSAKILEAKYKEIFGQNASYKNATFKLLEGPIAYYDSKNNVYAYFSCECGGECGGNYNHKLNSVEQSGATLKLNTTLTVDGSKKTIVYTFKYEESTGNYVFVSRTEK